MAGNNRMDLTYQERSERVSNMVKNKNYNSLSKKLVKEGDTSISDTFYMFKHGIGLNSRGQGHLAYSDPNEFIQEIDNYIEYTEGKRLTPTLLSFSLWMGVHSTTIMMWRDDPTHPMYEIMKRTSEYFHNYLQQKALDGELNPLMYFFLSKNYFGMKDKTEIVHRSQNTQVIDLSDQQRILNAAPGIIIDVEYAEDSLEPSLSNETKKDELDYVQLETLLKGARNEPQEDTTSEKFRKSSGKVQEKFHAGVGKVSEKFSSEVGKVPECNQKATKNDVSRETSYDWIDDEL